MVTNADTKTYIIQFKVGGEEQVLVLPGLQAVRSLLSSCETCLLSEAGPALVEEEGAPPQPPHPLYPSMWEGKRVAEQVLWEHLQRTRAFWQTQAK